MSDTVRSTARGTDPARSRQIGTNRFHLVAIDAQLLGLELIDLRQYRQTWVRVTIGLGSVSETKMVQDVRSSGGRRFTGRSEFLKVATSCRTSLACFSRASTYKTYHEYLRLSRVPRSYFSGQCRHQSTSDRGDCRLYSRTFHEKFFVQRANELFDGEFESGIGCHDG